MLAEHMDSAGLRPLFTDFFSETHARADPQARKPTVTHAVAMEVNLTTVVRIQETKIILQLLDRANGLTFMRLDVSLQPAYPILQLSACALESIVYCKVNVRMTFIKMWRLSDIDLLPVGQGEPDMDLVETSGAVMLPRRFEHDATAGDPPEAILKTRDVFKDRRAQ